MMKETVLLELLPMDEGGWLAFFTTCGRLFSRE
jgi:hypothetical protein